jgi:uncharacterized protein YgbK (DUF1537 family)
MQESGTVVLFDTLTADHLEVVGQLISDLQEKQQTPLFVVGSSGIDYALVKHWQSSGIATDPTRAGVSSISPQIEGVDRTIVLSGSCSPVTDRQINWALEHGFAEVGVDTRRLANQREATEELGNIVKQVVSLLDGNQSVIVHTSRGSNDPRLVASQQHPGQTTTTMLGVTLAQILHEVLGIRPVRRVAIVGGDTAGQFARALGIEAVEMIGPLEPGAPLCVVHSQDKIVDGLEVTFKGGQVGYDNFFGTLLSGQRNQALVGANS